MKQNLFLISVTALFMISCGSGTTSAEKDTPIQNNQYVRDPHSFAQPDEIAVEHIHLDIALNFDSKTITGTAVHTLLHNSPTEEVSFDINDMKIAEVRLDDGKVTTFRIEEGNEYGQALYVTVTPETKKVYIDYSTSPSAEAVQWLDPVQTSGKEFPFLFTQGQAILTRSWIPCQDSPGIRVTYSADVQVPADLMAVMSASNPQAKSEDGKYSFEMQQAIPPYLIALAVGDIGFEPLGDRTGVYAEYDVLPGAAYELEDMEKMILAAEGLYGKYRWDRYDVIVLPPSFPFGGMENPRLTFATPTILAGDKSLTSLIAHELAHSWSGNLVTNATWDDFWLNEGFTVYFEYRIMEEVYGKDYTDMIKSLGLQGLHQTIDEIGHEHADTHLKLSLEGRNPDDGMTDIAYEKGHMFLEMLEKTYGREKFDEFLRNYFDAFAFKNMTTEAFLKYLDKELISQNPEKVNVDEWVFGPGLPSNSPNITSDRFSKVDALMTSWKNEELNAHAIPTSEWSTHEWLHFIRSIPADTRVDRMKELDDAFKFTKSANSEIQGIWYEKAVLTGYEAAFPYMEKFLINVGRRKFLTPLYTAMLKDGRYTDLANEIYRKARPNYHSVSTGTMDKLLGVEG